GCAVACEAGPTSNAERREGRRHRAGHRLRPCRSPPLPVSRAPVLAKTLAGDLTPVQDDSWVCFVEAKVLSDAARAVTHDSLRNQLRTTLQSHRSNVETLLDTQL